MKICVAGAGSTRLPLMMASLAGAERPVDEVTLFDIRPERIRALMPVGLALCAHVGSTPPFRIATTLEEAVEGCDALILTIRPGFEEQRARDERACMELGVIGQETTGPAGFAFATRTIPAVARICSMARRLAPGFLPVVFTNPAGMVTRALLDLGFEKAVGICDSATVAAGKIARRFKLEDSDIDFEVSGLNHLSWTRRVTGQNGMDLMSPAMADKTFVAGLLPWLDDTFDPRQGIPVEYLYYYVRPDDAKRAMLAEPRSRGEALVEANARLFSRIGTSGTGVASSIYAAWLAQRNGSYMSYALGTGGHAQTAPAGNPLDFLAGQVGGYAEVAMELLEASAAKRGRTMALNVRNRGAIPELPGDTVVETDCVVDRHGIKVRQHAPMPASQAALVTRVVEYEELAMAAIFEAMAGRSIDAGRTAVRALHAHPLVPDLDMAGRLAASLFGNDGLTVQASSDMFLAIPDTRP